MISSLPSNALQQMLEALPIRIFWKDRESRYLGANQLFADDAGIPDPRSFMGKTDFYLFPFDQAEIYRYNDAEVMLTGVPKTLEEQLTMPDGQVRWVRTYKTPLRGVDGRVTGIVGMYQHITEQKRSYERLRMEALAATVSG
jgi:PAS domain S-box-containing protein